MLTHYQLYGKKNYQKNKEKIAAHQRLYYHKNKEKIAIKKKIYRQANLEAQIKRNREYSYRARLDVISHYSPSLSCVKCGNNNLIVLSIDHIDGGGGKHRREMKKHGYNIILWLRKNNYPKGFQVLCMNCQFIKKHEMREYYHL